MAGDPNKMRRIFLQRHGDNTLRSNTRFGMWQPESPLSEKGCQEVRDIASRHLEDVTFSAFYRSYFLRAVQTAEISSPHADWKQMDQLIPKMWSEFDAAFKRKPKAPFNCLADGEAILPGWIEVESKWILRGLYIILDSLEPGQSALAVSHQPLIGLLRGLIDPDFPMHNQSLGKGEIYVFNFYDNGVFHSVDHLK